MKSKEIISSYNTVESRRRNSINNGIMSILSEDIIQKDIKRDELLAESSMQYESISESLNLSTISESNASRNRKKVYVQLSELKEKIVNETFNKIIYESLLIDKDQKEFNKEYITEKSIGFFNELNNLNVLNIQENSLWFDILENINIIVHEIDNTNINEEVAIHEALELNKRNIQIVTETLQYKVTEAIKIERNIAHKNKDLINENGKEYLAQKEICSLFKSIQVKNSKEILTENSNVDMGDLLDLTMMESLLDYTLLETVYTMKLVNMDTLRLNKSIKYIYK